MDREEVRSTEVHKIVRRDVRKEREWRDYIRLNNKKVDIIKTKVQPKINFKTLVKV